MSDLLTALEALRERRSSRRRLLKTAVTGALGLAGAGLLAKGADAAAVAPPPPGGLDAASPELRPEPGVPGGDVLHLCH